MSVVAIVVIVVVVLAIVVALGVLMPRMRERARIKRRDMELGQRRKQVVAEQQEEADNRLRQAEMAEQRARIAEQEAQRERAEAQLRQERAALHERGLADHELIADHEREHFAGTSAVPDGEAGSEGTTAAPAAEQDQAEEGSGDSGLLGRFRGGDSEEETAGRP